MATTTTTSGGTVTSLSNTPQATDDIFTTGVIGTGSSTITEDLLGVVYLDVMSNDLGGNAKTLWSLDDATSLSTATKVYAPADLLVQDTSRIEATSSDTSFNGAKIWITSDGKVGYDAATLSTAFKAQLQSLAAGGSLTDSFTYAIRLGNGTLSWATAQVQFAGMNDSVTMSIGAQAGTVTEDATTTSSPADSLSAAGTIAFSDVDLSDTHTASFVAAGGNSTALGSFALASVTEAANTADGTVNWTYTLNNAAAQSLAQGQTVTETYVVTISDGHGSSTTQNVTITISGTNDQVQITSGVQAGDAKEDSGDYAASGSITFTDVDLIDTHSVTVTPGASGYLGSFTTDPLSDSTGTGSGSLGWNFAVDNAALQFLGEGQTRTQTYNVAIGDGAVQTVTITITGSNDQPTLTIADTSGAMSEGNGAATLSDSGALSFADLDSIDTVTVSQSSNNDIAWSDGTLNTGVASALVAGFSVNQNSWDYSSSQNLDFLGAGETISFSYKVVATDDSGAVNAVSATQTVTITLTGTNDQPTLTIADTTGAMSEDAADPTLTDSGTLSFSDADVNDGHTVSAAYNGDASWTGGSLSVGQITAITDGFSVDSNSWDYSVANSALQFLGAGESITLTFDVTVTDDSGAGNASDTETVTITLSGSNDQPTLTVETSGGVSEDATLTDSGTLSFTDADVNDGHTVSAAYNGDASWTGGSLSAGQISAITSGFGADSNSWDYSVANSVLQFLGAGESITLSFDVKVTDDSGAGNASDTETVTITITGTNDQPTLTIADTSGAMNEGNGTATLSDSGALSFADLDSTDTVTVSQTANNDIAWSNGTLNAGVASALVAGFSVDQNSWDYSSNQNLDFLGEGETISFSYAVVATDDSGAANAASATQTVAITLTGTNDQPTLTIADTSSAMNEGNGAATLSDSGALSFADLDSTDTVTVSQTANGDITWSGGTLNAGVASALVAGFSVDQNSWDYSSNQNLDFLGAGETISFSYKVVATDDSGAANAASAMQTVTITITGTNDQPTLTIADTAGAMNEGNGTATLSDSGALSFADLDSTDTVTVSQTANNDIAWSGGTLNAGVASALVAGFSVDQNSWDYSSNQNLDFLGAGETISFSYAVVATDDSGAANAASAMQTVTITITGSNDAPVLSFVPGNDAGAVQEDTTLTVSGQFSSADIDHDATATWSIFGTDTGTYGSIAVDNSGQWTYTLANGTDGIASEVQSLAAGESHNEVFTVRVSDGLGGADTQQVTVTVTGSNDAPVLSFVPGNDAGAVQEDTALTVNGQFSSADIDHAATATWTIDGSATGTYGSIAVDNSGKWTYTLANGTDGVASAVQSLAAGESHDEVFTVQVSDGLGGIDSQLVTITITGDNDAPTVTSGATASVAENALASTVVYTAMATDLDVSDGKTWTLTGTDASLLHINSSTGEVTLNTSANYETKSSYSFNVVVTDDGGLSDSKAVTLNITDVNEAPTAVSFSNTTTAINENVVVGAGIKVADIAITDDALGSETLSLSGADAASFAIVGSELHYVGVSPNFEVKSSYNVTVNANDATVGGNPDASQNFTLNINDVNEAPTAVSFSNTTTAINENVVVGAGIKVADIAITDDALGSETLSLSGADAASFAIVGSELRYVGASPNFEVKSSYSVTVNANDATVGGNPDASQNFTLNINNINVAPVFSSGSTGTIAENSAISTVAYDANATDDGENNNTLTYSLSSGGDNDKFNINSSNGEVTFKVSPNYETPTDVGANNTYDITVHANDGTLDTTKAVAITVTDVSEITGIASIGAPTISGNKTNVVITFSKAVNISTLSAADFQFTYGPTTITPTIQTSSFTAGNTVWNVQFDSFAGNTNNSGTLTLSGATYSFADTTAGASASYNSFVMYPAGVAGEPINLALTDPALGASGSIGVTITGMPLGWTLNAGTNNGDGTWTVQTNDPSSLTVTTPSDFAGALVLGVSMTWTNADGSIGNAYVADNVEAFAPGNPIFALSTDDNLTGSSGADTFVFAQPIGNNQIYNFDTTADKIDLIGFAGVTGFADLSITNDANGNALVSIGSGQTVTLKGVDAADLSEANFQFDVDPVMSNTGTLSIADGAIMPFGGSIHNSGTIELGSTGSETELEILFRGATLTGGGQVLLSDSAQNVIFGGSADTVLTNADNRISGAGQLGAGQMVLVNAGLILASGLNSLVLDTGTHTITNSGVLESTGAGGMTVASAVDNSGHLWANGGDMRLLADVTGNGSATIDGDATLTFSGAAHASVAFHGEGAGTLVIAQAEAAGSLVGILGLESDDLLTFGDLAFGANTQLSYSTNAYGSGGLLTVDDGVHRAEVNLLGHYSVEDFQVTDGGEAGTLVSYNGASSGTLVGSMLADVLTGGDGNDILAGRGGEDTLSGGAGADVFAYLNVAEGGDTILDYNFAEGDALDLSALLNANFVSGSSQASDFVQLVQSGSDITVQVDTDGAANGTNFADVAVLANSGTTGADLVRTWFGDADHTLTA